MCVCVCVCVCVCLCKERRGNKSVLRDRIIKHNNKMLKQAPKEATILKAGKTSKKSQIKSQGEGVAVGVVKGESGQPGGVEGGWYRERSEAGDADSLAG